MVLSSIREGVSLESSPNNSSNFNSWFVQEPKKSPAKAKKPKPKPEPKAEPEPPSEINLPDEVTVESLAKLLWISKDQIEATMTELSIAFGSDQDLVSPSDAELIAMSYGRTVILSKAVLVSRRS